MRQHAATGPCEPRESYGVPHIWWFDDKHAGQTQLPSHEGGKTEGAGPRTSASTQLRSIAISSSGPKAFCNNPSCGSPPRHQDSVHSVMHAGAGSFPDLGWNEASADMQPRHMPGILHACDSPPLRYRGIQGCSPCYCLVGRILETYYSFSRFLINTNAPTTLPARLFLHVLSLTRCPVLFASLRCFRRLCPLSTVSLPPSRPL